MREVRDEPVDNHQKVRGDGFEVGRRRGGLPEGEERGGVLGKEKIMGRWVRVCGFNCVLFYQNFSLLRVPRVPLS